MAIAAVPAATLPESPFLSALGPAARMVPPQTGSLAQRAIEEWKRNLCENKAVAILERMQAFFFPSSMADVALWLGPYMSISSKNVICTRTEKARKCRQITTNQPSHRPARRPANPPARLAFRQKKQQTRHTKRGKSPNKNTHKKICHRTQWSDHCITLKNMHTMN